MYTTRTTTNNNNTSRSTYTQQQYRTRQQKSSGASPQKPLPHRPFSLAPALELGESRVMNCVAEQGRRPSDVSDVSSINLTPLRPTFHIPPPQRAHLPPPYRPSQHHQQSSYNHLSSSSPDILTRTETSSSFPQTPHSHSHSHSYSSTSALSLIEKPHRQATNHKQRSPPSFIRRHWFVVTVCALATLGVILAIAAVMIKRSTGTKGDSVFVPPASEEAASTALLSSTVTTVLDMVEQLGTSVVEEDSTTAVPLP